jgi:phosphoglycolate phosphatase (TIGR01487 family)
MIRLILADVDGTLTIDRQTYLLNLDAVKALRRAESSGVKVGLVSGNSYPVLRGLAQYIGLTGGVVAENGCVAFLGNLERLCPPLPKNLAEEFAFTFGLRPSWQNQFRESDFAFYISPSFDAKAAAEWAKSKGLIMRYSGYAVHISANSNGKAIGVRKIIEMAGLRKEEVAGIGDSSTDVELLAEVGFPVALANSTLDLKRVSALVTEGASGEGVVELISRLLEEEVQ